MKHKQNGNALIGALGAVVIVILLLFLFIIVSHPYSAIDSTKQNQLNKMVSSTIGSEFENPFKSRIDYYLNDSKLTNKEFSSLIELYDGYNISKLIDKTDEFNAKAIKTLEADKKGDELISDAYVIMGLFMFFAFMVAVVILGWFKIQGKTE